LDGLIRRELNTRFFSQRDKLKRTVVRPKHMNFKKTFYHTVR
jgi:hypothetical protein